MGNNTAYKIHSNIYNVVMGFILKASQLLFPLITIPYVSRILMPEGIGRVSFAQSTIDIFTMLAMLGIPLYGIKACSKVRDDKIQLATTVKELLILNTIAMAVSYFLLLIATLYINEFSKEKTLLWIVSIQIALTVFGAEWFYQAIEQYDYITIRSVLGKLVSLVLMFILVRNSTDVLQYGFVVIIGSVGSNIFNIIRLHKFISLRSAVKCNIKRHLKPVFILFAFSATTTIYNSLATVMIGFFSNSKEIGYYSTAIKIKNLLVGIITVISSVLLPRSTYLLEQNKKDEFLNLIKNTFNFNLFFAIPVSVFCIIEAKNMILIISGENFLEAIPVMQILMPAIVFIGLTNVIGIQLFLPINKEIYVFISTLGGAIIDIIMNAIFIPRFGALGAAIATMITELVVLIIQYLFLYKLKIHLFPIANFLKITLSTIIATVITYSVTSFDNEFIQLIISAIIFFALYLFLAILLKEKVILMIKKRKRQ